MAVSSKIQALTYSELDDAANRLANLLASQGASRGQNIGLMVGNSIEHVIALYACARLGAAAVVIDPKWVEREVANALEQFDCGLFVVDEALCAADVVAKARVGIATIRLNSADPRALNKLLGGFPDTQPDSGVEDDDIFVIMLTSGTTGQPKGCLSSHRVYSHSVSIGAMGMPVREHAKELIVVPIYLNSGRSSLISQLYVGATVYLRDRFDPAEALELIESERITCLALAPPQCVALLQHPDLERRDTSSLEMLRKAGLPFALRTVREIIERVTPNLYQGYGGTEFSAGAQLYPQEQLTKLGAAGRALPGVEIDIVDDERIPLSPGEQGEIRVRSASICLGYFNNPEQSDATFEDGWYYSGDLGKIDQDGYLYVTGRKKDMVKTGGINVSPREIENVFLAFPEVEDVAVIGVPDDKWGEALKALVVLADGERLTYEDIVERCDAVLTRYKIPKTVDFVASIPRNALGKITADFIASIVEPGRG